MNNAATLVRPGPGFWSYAWISLLTIWIGLFGIYFRAEIAQFDALFRGFGEDIPSLTAFVIENAVVIWSVLLLSSTVQFALCIYFWCSRTDSVRRIVRLSTLANVGIQLVLITAMYLPIFRLGAVV